MGPEHSLLLDEHVGIQGLDKEEGNRRRVSVVVDDEEEQSTDDRCRRCL